MWAPLLVSAAVLAGLSPAAHASTSSVWDYKMGCVDAASCAAYVEGLDALVATLPSDVIRPAALSHLTHGLVGVRDVDPATGAWAAFSDVDKTWCPNNSFYEFIPVGAVWWRSCATWLRVSPKTLAAWRDPCLVSPCLVSPCLPFPAAVPLLSLGIRCTWAL